MSFEPFLFSLQNHTTGEIRHSDISQHDRRRHRGVHMLSNVLWRYRLQEGVQQSHQSLRLLSRYIKYNLLMHTPTFLNCRLYIPSCLIESLFTSTCLIINLPYLPVLNRPTWTVCSLGWILWGDSAQIQLAHAPPLSGDVTWSQSNSAQGVSSSRGGSGWEGDLFWCQKGHHDTSASGSPCRSLVLCCQSGQPQAELHQIHAHLRQLWVLPLSSLFLIHEPPSIYD